MRKNDDCINPGETMSVDGISVCMYQDDLPKTIQEKLLSEPIIAFDLEYKTAELNNFYVPTTTLALVQIYTKSTGVVMVRVNKGKKPTKLIKLLACDNIQKVFHNAYQDASILFFHWGILPKNLICTKEAAKLYQMSKAQSSSLRDLLKSILKVEISKNERISDWLSKDLTKEQVQYAARDVIYLLKLHTKLTSLLKGKGKDWYQAAEANWAAIPAQIFNTTRGVHDIYGELYNY